MTALIECNQAPYRTIAYIQTDHAARGSTFTPLRVHPGLWH